MPLNNGRSVGPDINGSIFKTTPDTDAVKLTDWVSNQLQLGNISVPPALVSVGLSLPSEFTISGSPVTSTGTLTGTWANQTANTVFAGPVSGGPAAPSFRALSIDDFIDSSFYVSDAAAGAGGVSIGELYKLDTANIFGLPKGVIKERIV